MFPNSLVQLIISKRIVQIQSSLISLDQILCSVENQILMLLSSINKVFLVSRKSYPGPSLIQEIRLKIKIIVFSRLSFQLNGSEMASFNMVFQKSKVQLYHLRKISARFKMTDLRTHKSGIIEPCKYPQKDFLNKIVTLI